MGRVPVEKAKLVEPKYFLWNRVHFRFFVEKRLTRLYDVLICMSKQQHGVHNMLTTKEVRNILKSHGLNWTYTNKTAGDTSNRRRVKTYFSCSNAVKKLVINDLLAATSTDNVKVVDSDYYGSAVIVKCILA